MQILSPLQAIYHPLFSKHQLKVSIKRDDLIHPIISGNKWRKLKYNINHAISEGYQGILSFGGCYSNHIHALAFAAWQSKLKSHGIIRGEVENQENPTLRSAKEWGMSFTFVDRKTYRKRQDNDYLTDLNEMYPDLYIVPEGGSNALALPGVGEVIRELNQQAEFDVLMTPVGSGGTLAGLINADDNQHQLLGIAVLKQQGYLTDEVNQLLKQHQRYHNWHINNDFHCGGYAKFSPEHLTIIKNFSLQTNIPLEPIYSGKMIIALMALIEQEYFKPHQHIVLLHTGGFQGLQGLIAQGKINALDWQRPLAQLG